MTFLAALFLVATWSFPTPAQACAPAYPADAFVTIAAEEALIVWDSQAGREHFIRRADFLTDAEDFGFLVPTPTQPELGEVPDGVFDRLRVHLEPEIEYSHDYLPTTCCGFFACMTAGSVRDASVTAAPSAVQVLDTARVAGLDAAVLAADDPEALNTWLSEHGYPSRPALVEWLRPYIDRGFIITAFRYSKSAGSDAALGSQAVRMTFETDRAFYPYREPSDHAAEEQRQLRLFVVGSRRLAGTLEAGADWDVTTELAAPVPDLASLLDGIVPAGDVADGAWLMAFDDRATVRAAGDLFFSTSDDDDEVHPAPIRVSGEDIYIPIPVEPAVIIGGIWWMVRRRRRKQRRDG